MTHANEPSLDGLVVKLGGAVPRYTSYPTAPHFDPELGSKTHEALLQSIRPDEPISLYLHVPFCDRLCWFCGCNTKHTQKYAPVETYVTHLLKEISQVRSRIGFAPKLAHVHFGGGSPSFLSRADFDRLAGSLRTAFVIDDNTEISVEIDPSDVTDETLAGMLALGVTRASIGVQDFDPAVQAAINRPQSFEQTRSVVEAMRAHGVSSVNIDALYGLPLQTEETIAKTIRQVIELDPDRVALFGYAHVPWMKKHQKMIDEASLPDTLQRFHQAQCAERILTEAGYIKIGIDHFAKPDDSMAAAAVAGTLKRNFQGYTTDTCKVLLGLGASSISRFDGGYVQNIVATGQYQAAIEAGETAAAKGFSLSMDDRIRAFMIERLMCDFRLDFADLERHFGGLARPYVAEAVLVARDDTDGLCTVADGAFALTGAGRVFARVIASKFDAYLPQAQHRYSKAV